MGNAQTWAISAAATVALVAGALLAGGAVSFGQMELPRCRMAPDRPRRRAQRRVPAAAGALSSGAPQPGALG
jgi:hypothetical protein